MASRIELSKFSRAAAIVVSVMALSAATSRAAQSGENRPTPQSVSYEYGKQLFFQETFGGNGRTCATCHDPRDEFSVSPELIQQRFQLQPDHPLFRAIDSDDGRGRDYTTMLTHAVFRVTVPLAPNVVNVDAPSQRTITVWRSVPTISNVDLTGPYLADGSAPTLQAQAAGAIAGHMQASRSPQRKELDALRAFEIEIYYPQRVRAIEDDSDPVPKPAGFTVPVQSPAAQRGKAVFDLHCRTCHDGELGDQPRDPSASSFVNVFVSDANRNNFPLLHVGFRQPDGTVIVAETPDPGRAAITGDLRDLNAFDTPPLRAVKHTAPYFHDNSAATLQDVIKHYNDHFQMQISAQQSDDLISYLELF